ncbi:unnamed protein product, partial [Vitis vinifera]
MIKNKILDKKAQKKKIQKDECGIFNSMHQNPNFFFFIFFIIFFLLEPAPPPLPPKPIPPSPSPSSASPPPSPPPPPSASVDKNVVTLEFQRQVAKELQDYFKQRKLEEANQGPFFGFIGKNEISNGRWAMFGFAVGMLTEYATGSDFVDQVKILLSNFGIIDLE